MPNLKALNRKLWMHLTRRRKPDALDLYTVEFNITKLILFLFQKIKLSFMLCSESQLLYPYCSLCRFSPHLFNPGVILPPWIIYSRKRILHRVSKQSDPLFNNGRFSSSHLVHRQSFNTSLLQTTETQFRRILSATIQSSRTLVQLPFFKVQFYHQ